MANPRKFSEKIALHTHRQAEETARFEQIMKEVSDATARAEEPTQHMVSYRVGSRARSQGGPIRRPHDRKLDTSPYSSGPFLSPPPDTSWRRTNSDSALHQSAMQVMNSDRHGDHSPNRWINQGMNGPERHDGRPRSSCDLPRVPGIHIYPSANVPGTIQIPISGNNTGSLPDLTNVDFSSPIHIPLDQEHEQGSSPYSSSPVNTSPSTLSPTSIRQDMHNQNQGHCFQFNPNQNHLSVPFNSRYPQHHNNRNKNVNLQMENKNNIPLLIDGGQINDMSGMYHHNPPPQSPSPTLQQAATYRSPRPSPQSSPSLGGRHSAPCSPGAPSPLSNDYHIFNNHQANQFQQHFEQLSMMDPPQNTMYSVDHQNHGGQMGQSNHQQSLQDGSCMNSNEITLDGGYYSTSPSQLVYPNASPSLHTTPNTPTSIPDIILTDFSSAIEDSTRQELVKQFENELFSDESIRDGLEPLDLDGLQMLSDPGMNLISEDGIEDTFRLDRS